MAPEQLDPIRDISFKVDVFAAGIILHEILTGNHPFDLDNNQILIVGNIFNNKRVEISEEQKKNKLWSLIDSMTDHCPDNRPTIQQVLLTLQEEVLKMLDDNYLGDDITS